jgi:Flp pilus assembly CpaE family ATPase
LDLRQVEKFLGEPVVGFVPSDYQTAVTSINLGQPLVQSEATSRIAAEIRRITQTITGAPALIGEPKPRPSLWGSLFKREPAASQIGFPASMENVKA